MNKRQKISKIIELSYMGSLQYDKEDHVYNLSEDSAKCHSPEKKLACNRKQHHEVGSQTHQILRYWKEAEVAATVLAASLRRDTAMNIHTENVSVRQVDDM